MKNSLPALASPVAAAPQLAPTHHRYVTDDGADQVWSSVDADEVLLLRIGISDTAALADLYRRHADSARAVAGRVLFDRSDAEDVVHDVFLTLWRRPHNFDPNRGAPRAWLHTVVRNRSVDRLRRRVPRQDVDDFADRLPDADAPDVLEQVAAREHRKLLWQAVARLPLEQRSLIIRAYAEGQTHQEIAEQTGLPLGTVKSRIRLGLEKLRGAVKPTDD